VTESDSGGQQSPSLLDEVRRFVSGVQSWARAAMGEPHQPHAASTCEWCPLCQFADVVRGENPEVSDKIAQAGTAVVDALRAVMDAAAQQVSTHAPTANRPTANSPAGDRTGSGRPAADRPRPRPAPPSVQHIALDDTDDAP
jgi:hypothetical protein